jgi:hypothetical protein
MRYENENEIKAVVESFERATISRAEWRHAEHLTVALHYLSEHDYETALMKMRDGIFNLLRAFEVDLSVEMPYHETLTVFWLLTVDDFRKSVGELSKLEIYNGLVENFDKNYPLRFYSREHLFSDEARRNFIAGNLKNATMK